MGGIPTNEFGEVQNASGEIMPGLFAVGECAAASFHGFNRLGTNSILELITMGRFAGERILAYLKDIPDQLPHTAGALSIQRFSRYLEADGKDNIGQIRDMLRTLMTDNMSIFRNEEGMQTVIHNISELISRSNKTALASNSLRMNQELIQHWELDNLLTVSQVITRAALNRMESRGAHFREDFPERSDAFNHHTLISVDPDGEVEIGKQDVDMSIFKEGGAHEDKFGLIERKY
jgi:succinate dehydrogenase / fumarate reductase flavoprotein subunit